MKKLKSISSGNYLNKLQKRRSFICGIKGKFLTNKEIVFLRKYKPWGIILFSRNIDNIYQVRLLTNMIKKLFNDKKFKDAHFLFERNIVFNPKDANSYLYLALSISVIYIKKIKKNLIFI